MLLASCDESENENKVKTATVTFEGTYWDAFIDNTQYGGPLLYGSIGETITEKSGNLNLGVPGMMYMGGIGGLIYVIPISPTFGGDVYGYGFLAMSVLMLGQWKPVRLLAAAFLFSLIKTVAAGYMSIPFLSDIGLSDNFYKSLPYIITLLVLTFSANRAIGPKAAGQPYDKGRR